MSPERCVVFEDAPKGVQAARVAGCRCVAVTNATGADDLGQADLIVDSLASLDIQRFAQLIDGG